MQIRLLVIIAAGLASGARVASADPASDLTKKGFEAFKAGRYPDAVDALKKAYALDHKPETLFALAQAERLGGDCSSAVDHYREVLERVSDINVGKLVEQAVALCVKNEPAPPPVAPPPAPVAAPPPPPQIITKTVVREVPRTDKIAATLFAVGAASLGGAIGLYSASDANHAAAERAYTQSDYTTFQNRSDSDRTGMFVAAGAGVALIAAATFKWLHAGHDAGADVVVIAPTSSGAALSVIGRW